MMSWLSYHDALMRDDSAFKKIFLSLGNWIVWWNVQLGCEIEKPRALLQTDDLRTI